MYDVTRNQDISENKIMIGRLKLPTKCKNEVNLFGGTTCLIFASKESFEVSDRFI